MRKAKIGRFCLITFGITQILFLTSALAAPTENFLKAWVPSSTHEFESADGKKVEVFGMRRFVYPFVEPGSKQFKPYSIGSIVTMSFDQRSIDFEVKSFQKQIRQAYGVSEVTVRHLSENTADVYVFEAEWKKINRHLKIFVSRFNGKRIVSVALFRSNYFKSFYIESELIQRDLTGLIQGKYLPKEILMSQRSSTEISRSLFWAGAEKLLPLAHADATSPPTPTGVPIPTTAPSIDDIEQGIEGAKNNNGNPLGGGGASLPSWLNVDKVSACGVTCDAKSADFTKCLQKIGQCKTSEITDNLKTLLDDSGLKDIANNATDAINHAADEFGRFNDFITNNDRLFAAGFSIAAGAALGASVVTLGLEGLTAGWGALYEAITGEKEDARRIAMFEKAREKWENMKSIAGDLEKQIDSMLLFDEMSKYSKSDREKMILEQTSKLESKKIDKKELEKKLEASKRFYAPYREQGYGDGELYFLGLVSGCQTERDLEDELGKMAYEIKGLEQAIEKMEKYKDQVVDRKFCTNLRGYIRKLAQIEGEMQDVRGILVDQRNQELFFQKMGEQIKDATAGFESASAQVKVKNKTKSVLSDEKERVEKQVSKFVKQRRDAIWDCVNSKTHPLQDIPIFSLPIDRIVGSVADYKSRAKLEKQCAREFDQDKKYLPLKLQLLNSKNSLGELEADLKKYDQQYEKLMNTMNYNLELQHARVKSYYDWFYELASEQSCYNQILACNGLVDEKKCISSIDECNKLGKDSQSLLLNLRRISDKDFAITELCK